MPSAVSDVVVSSEDNVYVSRLVISFQKYLRYYCLVPLLSYSKINVTMCLCHHLCFLSHPSGPYRTFTVHSAVHTCLGPL